MNERVGRAADVGRAILREVRAEDLPFMVGSIAYHAFVSLLPMLLLFMFVTSAVGTETLAAHIVELMGTYAPASAQPFVRSAIRRGSEGGVSLLGILALAWGTFKIFRTLDAAFAEIYDTERSTSLLDELRDGFVVLIALVLAVGVLGTLGSVIRIPAHVPFAGAVTAVLSVLILSVAFFPIYYVFPNVEVGVGEVLPGVLIAAIGWVALENLFGVYVMFSNKSETYGFLGVILLFIIWLYAAGFVLLLGTVVNAVLAGRTGDRDGPRGREGASPPESGPDPIGNADDFEAAVDRLVARARRGGLSGEEVARVLRERSGAAEGDRRARDEPS